MANHGRRTGMTAAVLVVAALIVGAILLVLVMTVQSAVPAPVSCTVATNCTPTPNPVANQHRAPSQY